MVKVIAMKRRVGRPKMAASERREEILRFMVTKEEEALIRAKAAELHLTLSEYLRFATIPKKDK